MGNWTNFATSAPPIFASVKSRLSQQEFAWRSSIWIAFDVFLFKNRYLPWLPHICQHQRIECNRMRSRHRKDSLEMWSAVINHDFVLFFSTLSRQFAIWQIGQLYWRNKILFFYKLTVSPAFHGPDEQAGGVFSSEILMISHFPIAGSAK